MAPTPVTSRLRRLRLRLATIRPVPETRAQWRGFAAWMALVGALTLASHVGPAWLRFAAGTAYGAILTVVLGWLLWDLASRARVALHAWRHRNDPKPALSRLVITNARIMPLAENGTPLPGSISSPAADQLISGYLITALPGEMPGEAQGPIATDRLATATVELEWTGRVHPQLHRLIAGETLHQDPAWRREGDSPAGDPFHQDPNREDPTP